MPFDLALLSALIGSNYPRLELIFMVSKVFEPLKFDCIDMMAMAHMTELRGQQQSNVSFSVLQTQAILFCHKVLTVMCIKCSHTWA